MELKNYVVPTAYYCGDDNTTTLIIAYQVKANNPREAKILTRKLINEKMIKEMGDDPDYTQLSPIWFEHFEPDTHQSQDCEGYIIGEPLEINL